MIQREGLCVCHCCIFLMDCEWGAVSRQCSYVQGYLCWNDVLLWDCCTLQADQCWGLSVDCLLCLLELYIYLYITMDLIPACSASEPEHRA